MARFWQRFYAWQVLALAGSGVLLALLFHYSPLDLWLADRWYDAASGTWPYRHAPWAEQWIHHHLRLLLLAVALVCGWLCWRHRQRRDAARYRLLAFSSVLIPLVIASGKRFSAMHCAWDIDRYGGYAPYADVLTAIPMQVAAGHCFPAAFLTSASWLMALGLCVYPRQRSLGWCLGLAAFVLALALGWVQQMRGAHFFSHTLWSLWASWAIIVLLHYLLGLWQSNVQPATDAPAAVPACVHEPIL